MSTYFVVGDIHGKAQMLEELMTEWDGKAQLVFLGDLIDRGENGKRSIEIVKGYVDHHGAVCLSGNHEYMFLAWLDIQKSVMITTEEMVAIRPSTLC